MLQRYSTLTLPDIQLRGEGRGGEEESHIAPGKGFQDLFLVFKIFSSPKILVLELKGGGCSGGDVDLFLVFKIFSLTQN